jgi:nifR3 family TIM-barrel protein
MMCSGGGAVKLVRTVVEAVKLPVTVKMRLGWDDANQTAPFFAREFEQAGVAAVTIHGRTRAQGFSGRVNLDGIRAVVEAVERLPVLGNGDVRTIADAEHMLRYTGCAGIAIGRGALLNPWFFAQLVRWDETGDPGPQATYAQRLAFMCRHFHLLVSHRTERFACLSFRKVANWYCRVLRPGRDVQQRLMMLGSAAEFDHIAGEIRALLAARPDDDWPDAELSVRVPGGPIEHW